MSANVSMFSSPGSKRSYPTGFSCPHEPLDPGLLDVIASQYSSSVLQRYLSVHGDALRAASTGLEAVLSECPAGPETFDRVWDVSLGELRVEAARRARPGAVVPAVHFALHRHLSGTEGLWECSLPRPMRLICGSVALPEAETIRVDAQDGRVSIEVRLGGRRATLQLPEAADGDRLPTLGVGGREIAMLPRDVITSCALPGEGLRGVGHPEELAVVERRVAPEALTACREASDLLARYTPEYERWAARVVRSVVPLVHDGQVLRSGSRDVEPGLVTMSATDRAAAVAETLVHEASHQYMHIISWLGPLDDGSDPNLYYSPVKGTERPIRAILVAYHAVANIILWNHSCQRQDAPDADYYAKNEERFPSQLEVLDRALSATRSLTWRGRALWEPVRARVAAVLEGDVTTKAASR